jgi:hypothetical protein
VLTKFQMIDINKFQWFEIKLKRSWNIASYNSWFFIRLFNTCRIFEQYTNWWFHRQRHFDVFFLAISKNSSLIRLMTKLEILAIVVAIAMMRFETKFLIIEKKVLRSWSEWKKNLICEFDDLQTKMIVWFENLINKKYWADKEINL